MFNEWRDTFYLYRCQFNYPLDVQSGEKFFNIHLNVEYLVLVCKLRHKMLETAVLVYIRVRSVGEHIHCYLTAVKRGINLVSIARGKEKKNSNFAVTEVKTILIILARHVRRL